MDLGRVGRAAAAAIELRGRCLIAGLLRTAVRAADQCGQRNQRLVFSKAQFQFHSRHQRGLGAHACAKHYAVASLDSGQNGSRIHRLCKAALRKAEYGVGWNRDIDSLGR